MEDEKNWPQMVVHSVKEDSESTMIHIKNSHEISFDRRRHLDDFLVDQSTNAPAGGGLLIYTQDHAQHRLKESNLQHVESLAVFMKQSQQ